MPLGIYEEHFKRYNKDVEAFNQVALGVVTQYGHHVNDLYHLMEDVPRSYYSDVTHFYTKEATELMVGKVLQEIDEKLHLKAAAIDYDKYFEKVEKKTEL